MKQLSLREVLYIAQAGRCCYCDHVMYTQGALGASRFASLYGLTKRQALARKASLEHLVKKADGGTSRRHNVALACVACNSKRQDTSWVEFATHRKQEWMRWKGRMAA
jgi:5-methylcytosine-specific restriction endonuclease McrA